MLHQQAFGEGDIGCRLHGQAYLPHVVVLHTRHRWHDDARTTLAECAAQPQLQQARCGIQPRIVVVLERDDYQPVERRVAKLPALLYLLAVKPLVIVVAEQRIDKVSGVEGLYQHLALTTCASRTPADLFQHLEGTLVTAKVRLVEQRIGLKHSHQTDVIEVQPFRNHLSTNQYIDPMCSKVVDDALVAVFVARGVEVHSRHPCRREILPQLFLQTLGAEAVLTVRRVALGA